MTRLGRWGWLFPLLALALLLTCGDSSTESNDGDATWQTIFSEDFNRADGALGSNWTSQIYPAGSAEIADHKLRVGGGTYWAVRYAGLVDQADIRVSARCSTTTDSQDDRFAVVARSRNLGNDWMQQEYYMAGVAPGIDGVSISRYVGSDLQFTTPMAFTMGPNKWYAISLECDGPLLTLIILDEATGLTDTLRTTDPQAALTGTTVSLNGILGAGESAWLDDFTVQSFE